MKQLVAASIARRYAEYAAEYDRLDNIEPDDRTPDQEVRMSELDDKMMDLTQEAIDQDVMRQFIQECTRLGY